MKHIKQQPQAWRRTTYNEHRPLPPFLQAIKDELIKRKTASETETGKAR